MSDLANTIKHVASPLARQTLLDDNLTRPSQAGVRSGFSPGCRW